jgi:DNA-directed RNA polymerase specialized sigma24 family protein
MGKLKGPPLTEEQRAVVRALYEEGLGVSTISMRLKVVTSKVERMLRSEGRLRARLDGYTKRNDYNRRMKR